MGGHVIRHPGADNILVTNDDDHLRNHGFQFDGKGWRLSPLYDVVPKPQVGLERRLVLGVGPQGRDATIANALAGAAGFDLAPDQAAAMIEDMRAQVAAGWEEHFTQAGVNRKRSLSIGMIRRLHDRLGISAEILIQPSRKVTA